MPVDTSKGKRGSNKKAIKSSGNTTAVTTNESKPVLSQSDDLEGKEASTSNKSEDVLQQEIRPRKHRVKAAKGRNKKKSKNTKNGKKNANKQRKEEELPSQVTWSKDDIKPQSSGGQPSDNQVASSSSKDNKNAIRIHIYHDDIPGRNLMAHKLERKDEGVLIKYWLGTRLIEIFSEKVVKHGYVRIELYQNRMDALTHTCNSIVVYKLKKSKYVPDDSSVQNKLHFVQIIDIEQY